MASKSSKGIIIIQVQSYSFRYLHSVIFFNWWQVLCADFSHVWLFATPWTIVCLPGSSVHGIPQARILESVAVLSSRGSNPRLLCLLRWQAGSLPLAPRGKPDKPPRKRKNRKKKTAERPTQRLWASAPTLQPTCRILIVQERQKSPRELWVAGYTGYPGTCTQHRWNSRTQTPDTGSSHRKGEIWIP